MTAAPAQPPRRSLRRVVVGAVLYSLFAPAALLALPLAGLLLAARPRSRGDALLAALSGGFGLWWLLQAGDLAEQVLRAGAIIATVVFAGAATHTAASVTHRALAAIGAAAAGVAALLAVLGRSWWEIGWSVSHRAGFMARQSFGLVWAMAPRGADGLPTTNATRMLVDLEQWINGTVQLMGAYYPATIALQMLAAFALATAVCRHLVTPTPGAPLSPLREFRFSEHLGWGVAVPLIVLLVPRFADARIAAGNLLIVTAALYALRGLAVVAFGLALTGGGGLVLHMAIALAVVFMLPVVLAGSILLGVLDAGLDLRRRWAHPPAGE